MSYHELRNFKRSLKYNKTSDIKGVFTIVKTINQLKTIEVEVKKEDITQLIRSYISNPFRL